MRHKPAYLGQDLYRDALEAGSLDPFAEAASTFGGPSSQLEQANTLKAIRFGLAGLALHNWQNSILEPLPGNGIELGGSQLRYRFTSDTVQSTHDHTVIRNTSPSLPRVYTCRTQGEFALETLSKALVTSAERQFNTGNPVAGIALNDIFEALKTYVILGKEHKLNEVPDAYDQGYPFWEDFYQARENSGKHINAKRAIAQTARNPIRFTKDSIYAVMKHFVNPYSGAALREVVTAEDLASFQFNQDEVSKLLVRTATYVIRASQRADGVQTVIDPESTHIRKTAKVVETPHGLETTWEGKAQPPTPHLEPGQTPPSDKVVMVTARNKCPIGYTPDAFMPMPAAKIMEAVLYYLHDNALSNPRVFMTPKIVQSLIA